MTHASQIAVVGDRLTTDVMMANSMGAYAVWIRDGVIPMKEKSLVSSASYWNKGEGHGNQIVLDDGF